MLKTIYIYLKLIDKLFWPFLHHLLSHLIDAPQQVFLLLFHFFKNFVFLPSSVQITETSISFPCVNGFFYFWLYRKDEADKIVERVPAPQMGNLDLPPEDGFTWRKYGQKEILGCRHPRYIFNYHFILMEK